MSVNRIEWPTLLVAVAIYGGFGCLTWYHHALPWWVLLPLGGYLVAWHGSLQHEAVHAHPTPRRWVNELVVFPSLWLWMPFRLYRETHLAHHATGALTDPMEDPESYYLCPEHWQRCGAVRRALLVWQNTAPGRLLVGPIIVFSNLFWREKERIAHGRFEHLNHWLVHVPACALVLAWVVVVCDIPLLEYIALYVYPGISFTLLRSFLEHRAHPEIAKRTVIVESGPLMSLLYLGNNLHALHHEEPWLPWYRLERRYAARKPGLLAGNGHYVYCGYGSVIARYFLSPKEPVSHPRIGGS